MEDRCNTLDYRIGVGNPRPNIPRYVKDSPQNHPQQVGVLEAGKVWRLTRFASYFSDQGLPIYGGVLCFISPFPVVNRDL